MAIDWGQGGPQNNALDYFKFGAALGTEVSDAREKRATSSALATIMGGADDPRPPAPMGANGKPQVDAAEQAAWADLYRYKPELAYRLKQERRSEQKEVRDASTQQKKDRLADLPLMGRLLDHAKDEGTYQQSRQVAQQYGIDVSQLPETFDPAWVAQQRETIKALSDPVKSEALSAAGKLAVDQGFKPGTPDFNQRVTEIFRAQEAKPYTVGGDTRLYTPDIGGPGKTMGGIPPGAIDALKRGEGTPEQFDQMFGPGSAAKIMGGQTAQPSGTFRPGISGGDLDHITMMSESGGNPNAVSPKGARGLMQVMPATARDPGFGIRPSSGTQEDDVRVGREYRRKMQSRYSGDPAKMWGAYNAGPGTVDRLIAEHGENWLDYAPAETRAYVRKNLAAMRAR